MSKYYFATFFCTKGTYWCFANSYFHTPDGRFDPTRASATIAADLQLDNAIVTFFTQVDEKDFDLALAREVTQLEKGMNDGKV